MQKGRSGNQLNWENANFKRANANRITRFTFVSREMREENEEESKVISYNTRIYTVSGYLQPKSTYYTINSIKT